MTIESKRYGPLVWEEWLAPGKYLPKPDDVDSETKALEKFLSPGDIAIDVGAHTGDSVIPPFLIGIFPRD